MADLLSVIVGFGYLVGALPAGHVLAGEGGLRRGMLWASDYRAWSQGTLDAQRLLTLEKLPPDPGSGLRWWQLAECALQLEAHCPPNPVPAWRRRPAAQRRAQAAAGARGDAAPARRPPRSCARRPAICDMYI